MTKLVSIEYPETREIVGGEIHPRGTGARLAAALKLLKTLQWLWSSHVGQATCPVCHKVFERGHEDDCELAALLRGEA